jgi:hypothetical protein
VGSHADSGKAVLLQGVDLVGQGRNLGEFGGGWFFMPGSMELGESAHKGGKAGLIIFTIKPRFVPSSERSF